MSSIGSRAGFVKAARVDLRHLVLHGASRIYARPKQHIRLSRASARFIENCNQFLRCSPWLSPQKISMWSLFGA
eukprot:58728-Pleurochrysis_carterae.AAC.1